MARIFTETRREARQEKSINKKLTKLATSHGLELSDDRLAHLTDNAKRFQDLQLSGRGRRVSFVQDGIGIDPQVSFKSWERVSAIDFAPTIAEGVRATKQQRALTTELSLDVLHALQDYTLLVDGGYIEKPTRLANYTNKDMSKVAERVGFVPLPQAPGFISADYDAMQAALFSPETFRVEAMLMQRQERLQSALGNTAAIGQG
ncbi:MAG: hypothetical protein JWO47_835 [Candidatus Saccharibacteria bacterium]|nr:hypothetical protein [Candidatus Saccharibacteria bacterium]